MPESVRMWSGQSSLYYPYVPLSPEMTGIQPLSDFPSIGIFGYGLVKSVLDPSFTGISLLIPFYSFITLNL